MRLFRRLNRWRKGPTTMEMYGLTDTAHRLLEEYYRNRTIGLVYDEYSENLYREWQAKKNAALDEFGRNGWMEGWNKRVWHEDLG